MMLHTVKLKGGTKITSQEILKILQNLKKLQPRSKNAHLCRSTVSIAGRNPQDLLPESRSWRSKVQVSKPSTLFPPRG